MLTRCCSDGGIRECGGIEGKHKLGLRVSGIRARMGRSQGYLHDSGRGHVNDCYSNESKSSTATAGMLMDAEKKRGKLSKHRECGLDPALPLTRVPRLPKEQHENAREWVLDQSGHFQRHHRWTGLVTHLARDKTPKVSWVVSQEPGA